MSNQPQPPQRIYAKWIPEVGEWDLWDEHYGRDDEAHVYVQQITEARTAMASNLTERLVADIRNSDVPISVQGRAMLDLAEQRDELRAACEAVIEAAETIHADWHPVIAKVLAALEKVRGTDA